MSAPDARKRLVEAFDLRSLSDAFYDATFGTGELVLGLTILEAQARYAQDGIDKYLLDIYNLVGDPATIMK